MPRKRKPGTVSTSSARAPTDHAAEGHIPTGSPGVFFNPKPWKGKSQRRGKPVDLFYALKAGATKTDPNVDIVCDRLLLETDPLAYAVPFAEAVAESIDANIRAGKTPAGRQSKPLDPEYLKGRGASGPRGVKTGETVSTLRVESGTSMNGFGRAWCKVKMTLPDARAWGTMFAGARFSFDVKNPIVSQALEELVDTILAPDDGKGAR